MSPEQAAGERDDRRPQRSLLARHPRLPDADRASRRSSPTSTPAMLVKHISERPIPVEQRRGDVPQDLARSVMMLLEKDPANRFPSASALVTALDTREAPAPRVSARRSLGRRRQRRASRIPRASSPGSWSRTSSIGPRATGTRTGRATARRRMRRMRRHRSRTAISACRSPAPRRRTSCAAGRIRTSSGSARRSRRICS